MSRMQLSYKLTMRLIPLLLMFGLFHPQANSQKQNPQSKPAPISPADKIDFNRDIRPILSENCFLCHGPDKENLKAGLRLDTKTGAFADLGGHFALVPGNSKKSELYARISRDNNRGKMPPVRSGKKLTAKQIDLIKRWIDQGANYEQHWAFVAPVRSQSPKVKATDWGRNPIDAFVLAKLEQQGLSPSARAERRRLIRRVTLDLTGLPPTPDEVQAFLEDKSDNAYEKVVDRLLASPHYGEHMALPWLDAARYADTNGYQNDRIRNMWPWRDWVIDAFNKNMPFDQFTIEQLAGDLLPNPTINQQIATGFNRNHRINEEGGVIPEEFRVEYVVDRVNTTSTVWMGLTAGCAQCHDHKYDPISQKEYYQLFGFFNSIAERGLDGGKGNADPKIAIPTAKSKKRLAEIELQIKTIEEKMRQAEPTLLTAQSSWEKRISANAKRTWHVGQLTEPQQAPNFKLENDGSIVLPQATANRETLTLVMKTKLPQIKSIRLELLPNESNKTVHSPILTHFAVDVRPTDVDKKSGRLQVIRAKANSSRQGFPVLGVVNASPKLGWSPEPKAGTAVLELSIGESSSVTGWLGNKLIDGSQDSANMLLNAYFKSPVQSLGSVKKFKVFSNAGRGVTFGFFLLRPDGDDDYRVVEKADFTADGSKGIKEYKLPSPWLVQPGDVFAHSGNGGPAFRVNAKTADVLFYPLSAFPRKGQQIGAKKLKRYPSRDYALRYHVEPTDSVITFVKPQWGPQGATLTFTLKQQHPDAKQWLHRLRISVTAEDEPIELKKLPTNIRKILVVQPDARNDGQKQQLQTYFRTKQLALLPKAYRALQKQKDTLLREQAAVQNSKVTTMVMRELPKPRDTFVLIRGQYDKRGEKVQLAVPASLVQIDKNKNAPVNRLSFAKWLVSPQHPLTARVAVNRYWQQYFGHGLVRTPDDFGSQGELPTHPLLLDWLATEFIRTNWDVKAMQKLIVTSATYQQSSKVSKSLWKRDPENKLLARGPRIRLSAQAIRDQALAVSGLLVDKVGGPPVKPYQAPNLWKEIGATAGTYKQDKGENLYRRSIYTFWKRTVAPPTMTVLDASEREVCSVKRPRTNTPLAALTLMNHTTFVEAARHLAKRGMVEGGKTPEKRIDYLFRLLLSRPATKHELKVVGTGLARYLNYFGKNTQAAEKLLSVGDSPRQKNLPIAEHAAYTAVANIILNLDEAITKE